MAYLFSQQTRDHQKQLLGYAGAAHARYLIYSGLVEELYFGN